jgi:hypothetical protein
MDTLKRRFEAPRSGRQFLSLAKTIYVFRCDGSGLYALTADSKGHVLPSRIYPRIRWRFERRLTLRLDRNSPKGKMVKSTLDAIAKHGFHLTHAAVSAELLEFAAQHYDKGVDLRDALSTPSGLLQHPTIVA